MRSKRRTWRRIATAVVGAALASSLWAFWLEPASLTVHEERITLRWPMQGPLRIAILTDLHVGSPFNGIAKLREIVDRTNAARPDLICILGDLVIQGVVGGRFVPRKKSRLNWRVFALRLVSSRCSVTTTHG